VYPAKAVQVVVLPGRIGGTADVPVRAVVGQDHPVALERGEDHPRLGAEAADIHRSLEPHPQAHGRQVGRGVAACVVPGRVEMRLAGGGEGEAEGMVDHPGGHLVVAGQSGQDRQPGGVGAGPAVRTQGIGAEIPDRPGASVPRLAASRGVPQLVEGAGILVHDQDMPITAGLHERVRWDRVGSRIGIIRIVEADG